MKRFLACAVAAALVLSVFACAKKSSVDNSLEDLKARGRFVLGLDDSFPPMGFRDENNDIVGFDIDLAKEVAARLGVEFVAQPIDWSAKEQELRNGKIDCIWNGMTITEERKAALYVTKAYLENDQVLIVKNDSPFQTLGDFAGRSIALQNGSSAEEAVNSAADFKASLKEIVPFQDNLMAINDLLINRVDAVAMDKVVADYVIKQGGHSLRTLSEALAPEQYGIAFRKEDAKLAEGVQSILEEMAADGTVAEISQKWFGSDITLIGK